MAKIRRISWITTALILGSGGFLSVSAQQTDHAPPTYDSDSPPKYQEPTMVSPVPLSRQNSYPRSESTVSSSDTGSGWTPPSPLKIHNDQGIRYISGGVGENERAELNALSQQFNLRLLFAMQDSGDYLSAVEVHILDKNGEKILTTQSKGPWFLAQLIPGDYTIEVSVPGLAKQQPERQTAHIEDSRQSRLNFYWR